MALSTTAIRFASAAVAAPGTSVGPSLAVPDNCHTIIIRNTHATLLGLVGIAAPPAALTEGTNAAGLPAGLGLTWDVGLLRERGVLDQAATAGSGLAFDAVGGAVTFGITYLCSVGNTQAP